MPLTPEQIRLARTIDRHVKRTVVLGGDGGDEALLVSMSDSMSPFKRLMDISTEAEMNQLGQQYDGFYRFAKLLERLAEAIANGTITVPK
jgi:hypothetical protein